MGDPAGFISRAVAFTIDVLLVSAFAGLAGLVISAFTGIFEDLPDTVNSALGTVTAASFTMFAVYCVICWTLFGQTVGKALMGLRVVRRDGTNPHIMQSIVRVWAYLISLILFIGFLMVLFTNDRRSLHDRIARTYVVYSWAAQSSGQIDIPSFEPIVPNRP